MTSKEDSSDMVTGEKGFYDRGLHRELWQKVSGAATHTWHTLKDVFRHDRLGQFGAVVLLLFVFMGIFAPVIAPYSPTEKTQTVDGGINQLDSPSSDHPFGTTRFGRDVFSQTIHGTTVSLLVGFTAAFIAVFIGTTIGLLSGYYGGWLDDGLMRFVDIMYGIPFIPFMIVLVIFLGQGLFNIIIAISLVIWRSTARVIRSQVLTVKERPYIEAADAIGASDLRILGLHIFPNVAPLTLLYGAFAVGWAIIGEASVSFIGFGDPNMISWGKMIFRAYSADAIRSAWWWVIPPGVALSLVVVSTFLVARTLEKIMNPELRHQE